MSIIALLVDLDGTLVDTSAANYAAYAAALAEAGVRLDREVFDARVQGRNWRQFLPDILAESNASVAPERIAQRKKDLYPDFMHALAVNVPLVGLIAASRGRLRTALVTTASRDNAQAVLAACDLGMLFEAVVTGDDVKQHKPHPEAYLRAAELLSVDPARCLAIEDSDIGAASAEAAGMGVLYVRLPCGARAVQRRSAGEPDRPDPGIPDWPAPGTCVTPDSNADGRAGLE